MGYAFQRGGAASQDAIPMSSNSIDMSVAVGHMSADPWARLVALAAARGLVGVSGVMTGARHSRRVLTGGARRWQGHPLILGSRLPVLPWCTVSPNSQGT